MLAAVEVCYCIYYWALSCEFICISYHRFFICINDCHALLFISDFITWKFY